MCACLLLSYRVSIAVKPDKLNLHGAGKQSVAVCTAHHKRLITGHGTRRSLLKEVTNQLRKVRLGLTDPSLAKSSNHGVRLIGAAGARSRRRLAGEAAFCASLDAAAIHRVVHLRGRCCYFEVSLTKRLNTTKNTHNTVCTKDLLLYSITFFVLCIGIGLFLVTVFLRTTLAGYGTDSS